MGKILSWMVAISLTLTMGCKKGGGEDDDEAANALTELSEDCRYSILATDSDQVAPEDLVTILMAGCGELLPSRSCERAAEDLSHVAPEDRLRLLSQECWIDYCEDGMRAVQADTVGVADRAQVLRDACDLADSGLLSQAELDARFDASILEGLDRSTEEGQEAWRAAYARLDIATWFNAEMMFSETGSLPEADRAQLREILRAGVLTEWEPVVTQPTGAHRTSDR